MEVFRVEDQQANLVLRYNMRFIVIDEFEHTFGIVLIEVANAARAFRRLDHETPVSILPLLPCKLEPLTCKVFCHLAAQQGLTVPTICR